MKRRELLAGAGAVVSAVAAGKIAQAAGMDHSMHNHDHGGVYSALIDAASECNKVALACEKHCFDTFAMGDTSLAACAREVNEMIAICEATIKAATLEARYIKELIAICKKSGEACRAECLKHVKKHDICRIAAEACDKCVQECDKALS